MPRYEITGTATDVYSLPDITAALELANAVRVSRRNAFGWSNQPKVATFYAADETEARRIADAARAILDTGSLPSLLPYVYTRG